MNLLDNALSALGLLLLVGCVAVNAVNGTVMELRESGASRPLVDYASSIVDNTLSVAAALDRTDASLPVYVTGQDFMGDARTEAKFNGRGIIWSQMLKAVTSNFRRPVPGESPLLVVRIALSRVVVRRKSTDSVSVAIRGLVEIRNFENIGEVCYSDDINVERDGTAVELDAGMVPYAFYEASEAFAKEFVRRWSVAGIAHLKLDSWRHKCSRDGVKAPEMENGICWNDLGKDNLVAGECVVACNDYDYVRAKTWAKACIATSCRDKLGGLELSRLRIVHDVDDYDRNANRLTLRFHAFARVPYVYQYLDINESGFITGDLELMGMEFEAAKNRLQKLVKSELERGRARVEFVNVESDKTFNLLTYQFKVRHY